MNLQVGRPLRGRREEQSLRQMNGRGSCPSPPGGAVAILRPASSLGGCGRVVAGKRDRASLLLLITIMISPLSPHAGSIGLFEANRDIGQPAQPGSAIFYAESRTYRVTGGGENMWFDRDTFHFVWRQCSGDVALRAAISWVGTGGNAHRKACLLIRQDLEPDAPYVDAVLHGNGLTSLQCRDERGAPTREIQANVSSPRQLRIERCGDTVWMSLAGADGVFRPSGGSFEVAFKDPVYVGLGVCAHDDRTTEEAVFSQVTLETRDHRLSPTPSLVSTLEWISIDSKDRRAVYCTTNHIEAPNWSRDGTYLLFNSGGRIYRIPATGGEPVAIDTGFAVKCNNDHGLSPDGTQLVISDQTQTGRSLVYLLPSTGGTPRQVTPLGPSYWHGWSPDGKQLAYCAERNGNYDIYTIGVDGGPERRLTTAEGLDDGPDYSPDGQYIYFNSERTGRMQIWRMHPDGSQQDAVTADELNNWFPHPSPDGKWVVFLSYASEATGHPANKPVQLRLIPAQGGPIQPLARIFGGQGTINVPSWSPDSRRVAFVSYRLVHH